MKLIKTLNIITYSAILSFSFLLLGCDKSQEEIEARKSTLIYCSEGSPESFDPQTVTQGTAFDASARQIYNRLVGFKPGTIEVVPSLAKSWSIRKHGTVYRFKLRQDVWFQTTKTFTPKRKFNADDVVFSFERQLFRTHPYHNINQRSFTYFDNQGLRDLIVKVNKVDLHTVEFVLKRPSSPFLAILAMEFASILSKEYGEQLIQQNKKDKFMTEPVGTGPFKLIRYQQDAYIRYQAHEKYWQGKEKIEHLVFAITPDPSLRFARLTAGECDVMSNPLPIHIEVVKALQRIDIVSEPGLNISYWSFNTKKPPFDNIEVRKAIAHAIDKDAIINAVYFNSAEAATNPIPPRMWSFNNSPNLYEYNPQLARNLLFRAGYPDGFETNIWAFNEQRSYNPNSRKTAELIQQDLKKIGIKAKIITYEISVLLNRVRLGEHETAVLGWTADNGDPDNFFSNLLSCDAARSGQNASFWCDDEFDDLIIRAKATSNKRIRTSLYKEAQRIFREKAPWVPIAYNNQFIIKNKRVKNLQLSPTGGLFFSNVELVDFKNETVEKTLTPNNEGDDS